MTLQEIIKSLDDLSVADQTSLLNVLQGKLSHTAGEGLKQPVSRDLPAFRPSRQPGSAVGTLVIVADDQEHLKDFEEYMA